MRLLGRFDPRLPREVWLLQLGGVMNSFGNGVILPFLVIYLHDVRGFSLALEPRVPERFRRIPTSEPTEPPVLEVATAREENPGRMANVTVLPLGLEDPFSTDAEPASHPSHAWPRHGACRRGASRSAR